MDLEVDESVRVHCESRRTNAPRQSSLFGLFFAQHDPQPFVLSPERRYAVVPVPECGPCIGGVLEGGDTAAQGPQVCDDLCEVEGGMRRLEALALEEEGERRGRERREFGIGGHGQLTSRGGALSKLARDLSLHKVQSSSLYTSPCHFLSATSRRNVPLGVFIPFPVSLFALCFRRHQRRPRQRRRTQPIQHPRRVF